MLNRDLDVLYRKRYILWLVPRIEISMYYIEISTSLFRDLDIVIRDLDLLIYSNSRSRIVFLIYYFFSMSLIRFRSIGSHLKSEITDVISGNTLSTLHKFKFHWCVLALIWNINRSIFTSSPIYFWTLLLHCELRAGMWPMYLNKTNGDVHSVLDYTKSKNF